MFLFPILLVTGNLGQFWSKPRRKLGRGVKMLEMFVAQTMSSMILKKHVEIISKVKFLGIMGGKIIYLSVV